MLIIFCAEECEEGQYFTQYGRTALFFGDVGHVSPPSLSPALPPTTPTAVKCNNNPVILAVLAALGCGFDCASPAEIQSVLDLGVPLDRILYANPCKQMSHIK